MKQREIFSFPQNVFVLSVVSLLNDIGGQTVKYAIPLFLSNALGVGTPVIGLIEGVADAVPQVMQPVSGWLSDITRKRKALVLSGQVLRSAILLLFFAMSWPIILIVRFLDRSGKGIQGAPRDALLSVSSKKGMQGKTFGLSRAFDNSGAGIGLMLAGFIVLFSGKKEMLLSPALFQTIVLFSAVPLLVAGVLIWAFVKDVREEKREGSAAWKDRLGKRFYIFLAVTMVFTLGNASDAFLILKAQRTGMQLSSIFFLLALFSMVSAGVSLPMGMLSDRIGRKRTLITGWVLVAFVYFGFARVSHAPAVSGLFMLYGIYAGMTEGVAKAFVADIVPKQRRGLAFGMYNLATGAALLLASLIAGILWYVFSPSVAFSFGGALAILAACSFLIFL